MSMKSYSKLVEAYKKYGRPVSSREIAGIKTPSEILKSHPNAYAPAVYGRYSNAISSTREAMERLVKKGMARRIKKGNRVYYEPVFDSSRPASQNRGGGGE